MRIVITGGAGFIGSHIVDALIARGDDVLVVDNLSTGKLENLNKDATIKIFDINSAELFPAMDNFRPEVVIHHAAQVSVSKSFDDPMYDMDNNIKGTINILQACVKFGVRKIVFASTAAVYGFPQFLPITENHPLNPISYYGASKLSSESYIKMISETFNLDYTIFRYANVYGPRQDYHGEGGVISIFANKVIENSLLSVFGNGEQTRDFIFIGDVVQANLAALHSGRNKTINISTGNKISLNTLIETFQHLLHQKLSIKYLDERKGDINDSCLSCHFANKELQWSSRYNLDEGLRATMEYYKNNMIAFEGKSK